MVQGAYSRRLGMIRTKSGGITNAGVGGGVPAAGGTAFFGVDATENFSPTGTQYDSGDTAGNYSAAMFTNSTGQSGTVTKIRVYFNEEYSQSTNATFGIYLNDASNAVEIENFLGHTNSYNLATTVTADGYYDLAMADSVTVNNGSSYWVLWWLNGNNAIIATKNTNSASMPYGTLAYAPTGTWPDEADHTDVAGSMDLPCIYIYFDY